MVHKLDMSGTIEFYRTIAGYATQRLTALFNSQGWNRTEYEQTGHKIFDSDQKIRLTQNEIYGLLNSIPLPARERAEINGIYGKPDLWFSKSGAQVPTTDISEAISPTAIIPSYRDNREGKESAQVHLFGLDRVIREGHVDDLTAKIMHAEGLVHEYVHILNWLGKREFYDGMPSAPDLKFPDGKIVSALDAFVEFGNLMERHSPISHYSSFFWKPEGGEIITLNDSDLILAIDEELCESVAAYMLQFVFTPDQKGTTEPFADRPRILEFVENYLYAEIVK